MCWHMCECLAYTASPLAIPMQDNVCSAEHAHSTGLVSLHASAHAQHCSRLSHEPQKNRPSNLTARATDERGYHLQRAPLRGCWQACSALLYPPAGRVSQRHMPCTTTICGGTLMPGSAGSRPCPAHTQTPSQQNHAEHRAVLARQQLAVPHEVRGRVLHRHGLRRRRCWPRRAQRGHHGALVSAACAGRSVNGAAVFLWCQHPSSWTL